MTEAEITGLVPRFIRDDRNGYALAAAIGKGMAIFKSVCDKGISNILNVDAMPEWRLDELAEELGCVYDTTAEIEWKRRWIRDAWLNDMHIGTPGIIEAYLKAKLEGVKCQEWWQYGAQPYHFRVRAFDVTPQKKAWADAMVERLKNLRSVYDGTTDTDTITLAMELEENEAVIYTDRMAGQEAYTGQTSLYGG